MKFGSLFSGIGGFDLGFARAGMECVWQSEIDSSASSVLAHHWPSVRNYGDITKIKSDELPAVELICGGFPCQDVSIAGKREGLSGNRSGLWFEFLRVIRDCKPEWVVIENVPGLLSSNGGRDFATILQGLEECGYDVAWRVLDTQFFGVPQRRRRVFIVGHLGEQRGVAAKILFEREGSIRSAEKKQKARKTAPTLPASGAGTSRMAGIGSESDFVIPFRQLSFTEYTTGEQASALKARDYKMFTDLVVRRCIKTSNHPTLPADEEEIGVIKLDNTNSNGWGVLLDGTCHTLGGTTDAVVHKNIKQQINRLDSGESQRRRIYGVQGIAPALSAEEGRGHGVPTVCYKQKGIFEINAYRAYDFQQITSRTNKSNPKENDPSPTLSPQQRIHAVGVHENKEGCITPDHRARCLRANGSHSYQFVGLLPVYSVRRLTPVECERLQGFPDNWTLMLQGKGKNKKLADDDRRYLITHFLNTYKRLPTEDEIYKLAADTLRYKQLGNAVSVPVIEWLGRRIMKIHNRLHP